jgi:nucleotide-binding universal stress UspA family protein
MLTLPRHGRVIDHQHGIIAAGGSELAANALAKPLGARATAVTVTDIFPTGPYSSIPMPSMIERYEAAAAESASKVLSSVSDAARKLGVACDTVHVRDQTPAEGIIAVATEKGCDLIIVASHGRREISRIQLRSQAHKVVTLSPVSVLVCR